MAAGAFVIYALIVGLEGTGRHFLEIAIVRIALLGGLIGFSRWSGAHARRLGRIGTGVAAVATVAFFAGAVGALATDGWSYDVLAEGDVDPPWYAYIIGLSGIVFALGTVLLGIAGRSAGSLAKLVIVAGATFPLVFALGPTAGHAAWLTIWTMLGVGLVRTATADGLGGPVGSPAAH